MQDEKGAEREETAATLRETALAYERAEALDRALDSAQSLRNSTAAL